MIWFYFKPSVSGQDLKLPYTVHPKQQKPGALFSWQIPPIILDPQFPSGNFSGHTKAIACDPNGLSRMRGHHFLFPTPTFKGRSKEVTPMEAANH